MSKVLLTLEFAEFSIAERTKGRKECDLFPRIISWNYFLTG
jgi:hypothetical protein